MNEHLLQDMCNLWCKVLEGLLDNTYREISGRTKFLVLKGNKYWRIISKDNGHESVHAFLEVATGNIYKPASWRAPAKHIRFNIFQNDFLQQVKDPHGGYLYMK